MARKPGYPKKIKPRKSTYSLSFSIPTLGKRVSWGDDTPELTLLQQVTLVTLRYRSRSVQDMTEIIHKRCGTPTVSRHSINRTYDRLAELGYIEIIQVKGKGLGYQHKGLLAFGAATKIGVERAKEIERSWQALSKLPEILANPDSIDGCGSDRAQD